MSSTNKTPNYQLPQFVNTDVPSWLGDFNSAMSKIDKQMKANDTKATGASTNAENANSSATQALETANQANTTANGANTNATNALSLATTANDNASTAKQNSETALSTANSASGNASSALSMAKNANTNATKALNDLKKFNLTNFKTWNNSEIEAGIGISNINNASVNLAYDVTGKIFKLYGVINMTIQANQNSEIILRNSGLRPSSDIQIQNAGFEIVGSPISVDFVNFTVKQNGDIIIQLWNGYGGTGKVGLLNCLYILNAFDQTIVDPSKA